MSLCRLFECFGMNLKYDSMGDKASDVLEKVGKKLLYRIERIASGRYLFSALFGPWEAL